MSKYSYNWVPYGCSNVLDFHDMWAIPWLLVKNCSASRSYFVFWHTFPLKMMGAICRKQHTAAYVYWVFNRSKKRKKKERKKKEKRHEGRMSIHLRVCEILSAINRLSDIHEIWNRYFSKNLYSTRNLIGNRNYKSSNFHKGVN